MRRGPRLDYPGALHHLIVRGIERSKIFGHLAVCHYGLSVTAVARHLHVSRQSIARGLERAADTFARRRCTPADFIGD